MDEDLRHFVNDGLMALFFLVVGLEIKRELVTGELQDRRAAALPVFAAVGRHGRPGGRSTPRSTPAAPARHGWGIPMATDIAFALGVLALLGPRVPSSLKLFLLSLAIVDDVGAIVVIAVFYTGGLDTVALGSPAVRALASVALRRGAGALAAGARRVGVGVLVRDLQLRRARHHRRSRCSDCSPRRDRWPRPSSCAGGPGHVRRAFGRGAPASSPPSPKRPCRRPSISQHLLHPVTSFVIVPLFALANAGVPIRVDAFGRARHDRGGASG